MVGMLLSGCTPRQAALVLRAVADVLLAEAAAETGTNVAGGADAQPRRAG